MAFEEVTDLPKTGEFNVGNRSLRNMAVVVNVREYCETM